MAGREWELVHPAFRETNEYSAPLGPDGHVVRTRMETDLRDDRLLDFAVMHLAPRGGRLLHVVTYDIHTSEFHMHRHGASGSADDRVARIAFFTVDTLVDVQHAYDRAQELVVEEFEENLRRWRHG